MILVFLKKESFAFSLKPKCVLVYICWVTNCSPNPDGIEYGPNKPNTINLWESGWKNWVGNGFYNG